MIIRFSIWITFREGIILSPAVEIPSLAHDDSVRRDVFNTLWDLTDDLGDFDTVECFVEFWGHTSPDLNPDRSVVWKGSRHRDYAG